jgi:hypothetical protein
MFKRFKIIKVLFFILVLLYIKISFSQSLFTFDAINISDIGQIESKFNSAKSESDGYMVITESFYPYAGKFNLEQPIVYLRRDSSFVSDLQVEYYYSKEDSIVRLILYTWDYLIEAKKQDYEKYAKLSSIDKLALYKAKFDTIAAYLKSTLGNQTEGSEKVTSMDYEKDKKSNFSRLIWESENVHTELWRIWVSQANAIENLRVRVKIYRNS